MKEITRYRYRQRIKELEIENSDLRLKLNLYRSALSDIYNQTTHWITQNYTSVDAGWLLRQMRGVWE